MAVDQVVIDEPARRVSPAVVLVIVLALLLIAGGLGYWLFMRPQPLPPAAPVPTTVGQTTTVVPSPSPSPALPPSETFEVFEAKDPFRPLILAGAGPSTAGGGGGGGGSTSTASTGTSGTGGGATAAPPPGGAAGAGGGAAPAGGRRIALLDVVTRDGGQRAQVKVGSTVHTVSVGEVFADNFKLLSINGSCATFLHGDDKFTLCEGEEIIK